MITHSPDDECVPKECRSPAAAPEFPYRDAERAGLVGEVVGDAGAGEDHDADRQDAQELVVALERGCLAVTAPVGAEGDLRDLPAIGPAGGDPLGTLR